MSDPTLATRSRPVHVFFNIFKAVVGAGSFALPLAFMNGGIWGSIIGLIVLGLMSDYTIKTMVRTKVFLGLRGSYPEYVEAGFGGKLGKIMSKVVYGAIVLTVMGVCTVYLVFCGKLINNLLGYDCDVVVGPIAVMGTFLAIVSWLPSLRKISFLSLVGDAALVIAMICVVVYGAQFGSLDSSKDYPQISPGPGEFMKFYGPVVFLYAIHMLIVPLHNEMAEPAKFDRTLDFSLIVVVISNGLFAMFAFLLFYPNIPTQDPITSALTQDWMHLNKVVDVSLILDLTFTFTVIFVAGRDVVEQSLGWVDPGRRTHFKRMAVRTFMVALCTVLACVLHDYFSPLVDFIAGLTMSPLSFVIPPILYLRNLWPHEYTTALADGRSTLWLLFACGLNVTIIMVGIATTVYSTYGAVDEMISSFKNPQHCVITAANSTTTMMNATITTVMNGTMHSSP